jgi:hypothetical protein
MAHEVCPRTITGFTEYIKVAYAKAQTSMKQYGIAADRLNVITPLYNAYIQAEAVTADPATATTGARRARDSARRTLESKWRKFINESIRYNSQVPIADLIIFGVKQRDKTYTKAGVPNVVPILSVKQVGRLRYELEVFDSTTGKKKKPKFAAGSHIYLAVTESGKSPEHGRKYHKMNFSSNGRHVLEFPLEQIAKQANIYARYSNPHGKEGPVGLVETVTIG